MAKNRLCIKTPLLNVRLPSFHHMYLLFPLFLNYSIIDATASFTVALYK